MTDEELRTAYQHQISGRPASRAECPEPEQLAALVEHTGRESERLIVLGHAMACPRCHRELALLQAIHAAGPRAEPAARRMAHWRWRAAAGLVVALAGGGGLLARARQRAPGGDAGDVTRGPNESGSVTLIAARQTTPPAAAGTTTAWQLAWHAVAGAVGYQVEVLGAEDQVLFSRQTADTTAVAPVAREASGATWWVRATMADGSERRSKVAALVP